MASRTIRSYESCEGLAMTQKAQKALVVDLDRCIGCHACEIACKQENGVALGVYWNRVLTVGPDGKFPNIEMYFLPTMCQECTNPPCVRLVLFR
jgi:Fe-S-cluster-containing dehydrogenase component